MMDFKEYQESAKRTDGGNLTAHFLGLCGEAGEVVELYKKHIAHGHSLDLDKLAKELGDVLWYASSIASGYDLSLEDIAIANIAKLKARYPEKFSAECSINRVEYKPDISELEVEVFAQYAAKGYTVLRGNPHIPHAVNGYSIKDCDNQVIWTELSWWRLLELRDLLLQDN